MPEPFQNNDDDFWSSLDIGLGQPSSRGDSAMATAPSEEPDTDFWTGLDIGLGLLPQSDAPSPLLDSPPDSQRDAFWQEGDDEIIPRLPVNIDANINDFEEGKRYRVSNAQGEEFTGRWTGVVFDFLEPVDEDKRDVLAGAKLRFAPNQESIGFREALSARRRPIEKDMMTTALRQVEGRTRGLGSEAAGKYWRERVPFAGMGFEAFSTKDLTQSLGRIKRQEGDYTDYLRLADEAVRQAIVSEAGFLGKVGDIVTEVPSFAVEFMLTGGAYTGAKTAVGKGAVKVFGKWGATAIGKAVTKALGFTAGVAAQTALNPQHIAANAAKRMQHEWSLSQDDAGKVEAIVGDEGDGFAAALFKAFPDTMIEFGSERLGLKLAKGLKTGLSKAGQVAARIPGAGAAGEKISAVHKAFSELPSAARVKALKAAFVRRFITTTSGDKEQALKKLADMVAQEGGWHGVLGEMLEERAGEVARDVTFLRTGKRRSVGEYFKDLMAEAVAFSVFPGAKLVTVKSARLLDKRWKYNKQGRAIEYVGDADQAAPSQPPPERAQDALPLDAPVEQPPPEVVPGAAQEAPGQVDTGVVAEEPAPQEEVPLPAGPSRNDFDEVGLTGKDYDSRPKREKYLADRLAAPAEEPAPVEAAPVEQAAAPEAEVAVPSEAVAPPEATQPEPTAPTQPTVQQIGARLQELGESYGVPAPQEVAPKSASEREAAGYVESLGLTPVFTDLPDDTGFRGASGDNVVLLKSGGPEAHLWNAVGHEVAHGTGADATLQAIPEADVEAASQRYMETTSPTYHARLEADPALRRREGVATLVGDFMQDKAFRDQLFKDKPTLWMQLRDLVLKAIGQFKPSSEAAQAVLKELRSKKMRTGLSKKAGAEAKPVKPKAEAKPVPPEVLKDYPELVTEPAPSQQDLDNPAEEAPKQFIPTSQWQTVPQGVPLPRGTAMREDPNRPGQYQAKIREPGTTPSAGFLPNGAISIDDVTAEAGRLGNRAKIFVQRMMLSQGNFPRKVFDLLMSRDGRVNAILKQVAFTIRDFDLAAKKVYGGERKMTDADRIQIDAALKGDLDISELPYPMQAPVREMRNHIDTLSRELINSGVIEGELEVTVEENMGLYVTRAYKVFTEPDWADKVPADVRNRAKAWLRSENPDASNEQIERMINTLLYRGKESPMALIAKGKLGSKDLSILKERKDLPKALRELWGEYEDVRPNYYLSIAKMANLLESHRFLTEVREEGLGEFLFDPAEEDPNQTREFHARISAEGNANMQPLDGLMTTPEIAEAFNRVFATENHSWAFRRYMALLAITKYAKTVGSAQATVRNFVSNVGFAIANGHINIGKMPGAIATVGFPAWQWAAGKIGIDVKDSPARRKYIKRLIELNIYDQSARAGEVADVLRDASDMRPDQLTDYTLKRGAKKAVLALAKFYQAMDNVWKIYAFENEKARYRKAKPGWTESQVEEKAASIVKDTYPTYSMIPEAVRKLRRFPLVGSFVSFNAEVVRITTNMPRIIASELRDPDLKHIGAQRLAGVLVAAALPATIALMSRALVGVTDDEDEDIRRFLPPWQENSDLVYLSRGEDGVPTYVDLSYTDPFNYLRKPVTALLREGPVDAVSEAADPFFSEEMLTGKLLDVSRNKKPTGGQVYNPQDSFSEKTWDQLDHIYGAFEPGTLTSVNRVIKGFTGEKEEWGRTYDPAVELIAVGSGFRAQQLDVKQSLGFKVRNFNRAEREAQSILTTVARNQGAITPSDLAAAHASMERSRRKLFDDMHKDVWAAIRLGMDKDAATGLLRSAGMGKAKSESVLSGDYEPYSPSDQFMDALIRLPHGEERADQIRELIVNAHEDPEKAAAAQEKAETKRIISKATTITRAIPRKITSAMNRAAKDRGMSGKEYLEMKKQEVQDNRKEAAEWFQNSGITTDQAVKAYGKYLLSLKSLSYDDRKNRKDKLKSEMQKALK